MNTPAPSNPELDTDPMPGQPSHPRRRFGDTMEGPCPYADDHPAFESRLNALELANRESSRDKREASREWTQLLLTVGRLDAKMEGLNGRLAGYLIAGATLAGALSFVASRVLR